MSILNYNTALQSNNTDLQAILDAVNELPDAIGYKEVEWSENEDAIIDGTISNYTNDRIITIVDYTFYSHRSLTAVSFPACTSIGNYAFHDCTNLTSVSFPACTSIGYNAFLNCSSLTSVNFPACTSIGGSVFRSCTSLTTVSFPVCTTIGGSAFYYCTNLTSVSFPACTNIGYNAFYYCYNLTSVSFPACTSIDGYAFQNCRKLTSLYLTGSSLCKLSNSNAFTSTPIGGYSNIAGTYGSIYVQASLLTSYQTATNWTYFSSRFVGI